jgi:hypothetical protein
MTTLQTMISFTNEVIRTYSQMSLESKKAIKLRQIVDTCFSKEFVDSFSLEATNRMIYTEMQKRNLERIKN